MFRRLVHPGRRLRSGAAELPQAGRYEVRLRLSNRARRVAMGEKGTWFLLIDGQVDGDTILFRIPSSVPFDTILQPGESI